MMGWAQAYGGCCYLGQRHVGPCSDPRREEEQESISAAVCFFFPLVGSIAEQFGRYSVFFIFIFFENIFYRNIFLILQFIILYPSRPPGGLPPSRRAVGTYM